MQINGKVRDVCVVSQLKRSVVSSEQDEVTTGYHVIHLRYVLSRPNNTEGINMLQNFVQRVTASPLSNYTLIVNHCKSLSLPSFSKLRLFSASWSAFLWYSVNLCCSMILSFSSRDTLASALFLRFACGKEQQSSRDVAERKQS